LTAPKEPASATNCTQHSVDDKASNSIVIDECDEESENPACNGVQTDDTHELPITPHHAAALPAVTSTSSLEQDDPKTAIKEEKPTRFACALLRRLV
jgi:hypothetical protein